MLCTKTNYQPVVEGHSYLLRYCLVSLSYDYAMKTGLKHMAINSFLEEPSPLSVHVVEDLKKIQIQNLHESTETE